MSRDTNKHLRECSLHEHFIVMDCDCLYQKLRLATYLNLLLSCEGYLYLDRHEHVSRCLERGISLFFRKLVLISVKLACMRRMVENICMYSVIRALHLFNFCCL